MQYQKRNDQINIKISTDKKNRLNSEAAKLDWTLSKLCDMILTQWLNDVNNNKTSVYKFINIGQNNFSIKN